MATQVVFRKVTPSKALENFIKEHAMKMEKIIPGMYKLRVTIDGRNRAANDFTVSTSLQRRGGQFFSVQRDIAVTGGRGELYTAVKNCMDALTKSIEHHLEKRKAVLFYRTRTLSPAQELLH